MATRPKSRNGEFSSLGLIALIAVVFIAAMMFASVPLRRDHAVQTSPATEKMSSLGISYQSDAVVTVGNHSYIPILPKKDVLTKGFPQTVLELIDAFERDHPELNVTGWKLLIDAHGSVYTDTEALGIFLDHQPSQ